MRPKEVPVHSPTCWPDLLSAALLGTRRRRASSAEPEGRSSTLALLDAAAVSTVWRRASLRPAIAAERLPLAPHDPRPALPPAARRRLASLLAGRETTASGTHGGTDPDLAELLPGWLGAAREHGYRAPEELLPALLDAARGRTDLRPAVLAFGGPRALWLARINPEWRFALRAAADGGSGAADIGAAHRTWQEGLFAERVALLSAVREADPAVGRELLSRTWSGESAEDRLMFLDALRPSLVEADEVFLEQAMADRSTSVRALAAELLSTLPGSALAARMAVRARACVHLVAEGGTWRILVEAPYECDAGMRRDGVTARPPAGRGTRSWWLTQLVAAAPLETWRSHLGGLTPARLVSLPVADGWRAELHDAWCQAAVRQGNADWARALAGVPVSAAETTAAVPVFDVPAPGGSSRDVARLLAVLPPVERADRVARFIASHGLSHAFQLLAVCEVPWSEPLGRAVVDALDIARDAGGYPWSFSGVMGLAERCLAPEAADHLRSLTAIPEPAPDTVPGAGGYWSEAFQRLVSTLELRALMAAELDGAADGGPWLPPRPAA
ncbi:DUF5691 domain-containing protein [Streptomyces sp. NPDC059740]|uniref:DUF5691 domain-containing protein n=1 Tax=Streptomyces sp. NPDC059740 TaxID=3346926 RepID=UPI00364AEEC5